MCVYEFDILTHTRLGVGPVLPFDPGSGQRRVSSPYLPWYNGGTLEILRLQDTDRVQGSEHTGLASKRPGVWKWLVVQWSRYER